MMTPEIWAVIAAVLLALSAVAGWLALFGSRRRWEAVVIGGRVAALAALVVAMIAAAGVHGRWSAGDPSQAMLGLVVAILVIHLVLAWRLGTGTAGPMVDLVSLALTLVSVFVIQAGPPGPICVQLPVLYQAQWVLLLLGGGSVLVAACAGLMLILRKGLSSRGWDSHLTGWGDLHGLVGQAALLALAVSGCGLVVGVWWAWRTSGTLAWDSAREVWMAVAWLLTAMSSLAWQLDDRASRWAAALALVAAAAMLLGFLVPVNVGSIGI